MFKQALGALPVVLGQGPEHGRDLPPGSLRQGAVQGQQLGLIRRKAPGLGPGLQPEQPVGGGVVQPEQGGQGLEIRLRNPGIT